MKRYILLSLLGAVTLGTLLRAEPLFGYALWGSDTGEYYHLTSALVGSGFDAPQGYQGWGETYPYFPGLFVLAGSLSLLTGWSVILSLLIIPVFLVPVSLVAIFLITVRVTGSGGAALLASGSLAVLMPHVFSTSHPMPGTLGDALLILGLLALLLTRDVRGAWPVLAMVTLAIIPTHHLSSYLFILASAGGLSLREILRRNRDARRILRESLFIIAAYVGTVSYWTIYARPFQERILAAALPPLTPAMLLLAALAALLALPVILLRLPSLRLRWSIPGSREILLRLAAILTTLGIILIISVQWGIPATTMRVPWTSVAYFLPLVILMLPVIIGCRVLDFFPEGNTAFGWFAAIALSSLLGVAAGSITLSPYRHMEYLMIPLAVLIVAGMLLVHSLLLRRGAPTRTVPLALGTLVILSLNAAIAYPPQDVMLGFQEGTFPGEVEGVLWAREHTPLHSTFASDHRMSSLLFGFAGGYATWDTTPLLFSEEAFTPALKDELSLVDAPHEPRRVQYIFLSKVMLDGVALDPNEPARPLSPASLAKFTSEPFLTLYDNGSGRLLILDWSRA